MWQRFTKTRGNKRRRSFCSVESLIAVEKLEARKMLTTFVSNDVPKQILDKSTITSDLDFSLTGKSLVDVNVSLTVQHTFDSDVDIYLIAPDGRSVTLSTDNGASGNGYINTTFDDEAENPITAESAPFTGVFRPEGSLSVLRGMDPAGTWQLKIIDDANSDIGTLESWSLDLSTTGSAIEDMTEVSPDPRNSAVDSVDIVLTHPLRFSSFSIDDLTLTRNGIEVLLDNRIQISSLDNANTYRIQGLDSFTSTKGNYQLSVSGEELIANDGGRVFGNASESWTLRGSTILEISPVSPNPRNAPVDELITTFSNPLNLATFSYNDLELRRNDDLVPLTDSVSITRIGQSSRYRISGLETFTNRRGSYELTVLTRRIIDEQGLAAEDSKTTEWSLIGPTITRITGISGSLRNTSVGTVSVQFLFPLDPDSIDIDDIELLRNGDTIPLDNVTVVPTANGTIFEIRGLSQLTEQKGAYELHVSANGVKDLFGNSGSGNQTVEWSLVGPQVTSVISPVLGTTNLPVNTVEVRLLFRPDLTTFDFQDVLLRRNASIIPLTSSVEISEINDTNTYRISGLSEFTRLAGNYSIEVSGRGLNDVQGRSGGGSDSAMWRMSGPSLSRIVDPPASRGNREVNFIDVQFLYPASPETFDFQDVTLTLDNIAVPLNERVIISPLSGGDSFRIQGLGPFTADEGTYRLLVNGAGMADAFGNAGSGIVSTSWTLDVTKPSSVEVLNVTPNPRLGQNRSLNSITMTFREQILASSIALQDFTLRLNGGSNLLDQQVLIRLSSDRKSLTISNLDRLTSAFGEYKFRVSGSFSDLAGNTAILTAEETWRVIDAPLIRSYGRTIVYREESGRKGLMNNPQVTDTDSAEFSGGSLTVSIVENQQSSIIGLLDRPGAFSFVSLAGNQVVFQDAVIGVKTGGGVSPLVIRLNPNATPIAVSALLRSVTFQAPGEQLRRRIQNVKLELNDGTGGTAIAKVAVLITPVNDPATIMANSPVTYEINSEPRLLAPQGTVQDPESIRFTDQLFRVRITKGRDGTEILALSSVFAVVDGSVRLQGVEIGRLANNAGNSGVLVVRLNGNATLNVIQTLFRSITFRTSGSTSLAKRTVGVTLQAVLGNSDLTSIDVNVI